MLHTRIHKIEDVHGASALAIYLTCKINPLDAGFRFGGYLWLNDSAREGGIQEYAVVRGVDGLQVESISIRTGDDPSPSERELAQMIRDARDGKFDDSEVAIERMFVELPQPERGAAERRVRAETTEAMAEFGYIASQRRGQPCASLGCPRLVDHDNDDPHCTWCIIDMQGGYG